MLHGMRNITGNGLHLQNGMRNVTGSGSHLQNGMRNVTGIGCKFPAEQSRVFKL